MAQRDDGVMEDHPRPGKAHDRPDPLPGIDYIDWKQGFYDDVLSGKTKYYSNLINTDN